MTEIQRNRETEREKTNQVFKTIISCVGMVWFIWFYGISTIVAYLMLHFLYTDSLLMHTLEITFLNKPELICLHISKYL